ncbi:MAG: hypothetical protein RLZZ285_491 [Actinomycetota bacterium]
MLQISRRRFIYGSVSALGFGSALTSLLACSSSNLPTRQALPDGVQLVQRFPQILVPGEVRLPISLAQQSGTITTSSDFKFPETLTAKIIDLSNDSVISENVNGTLHSAEILIPYYPFRTTIEKPGNYMLVVDGGSQDGAAFSVLERDQVLVPKIGDTLPSFDTPTFDNARGVDPICTQNPEPCAFHKLTLTEAMQLKKPVAYLIGTPAHCSTGTCAPALKQLINVAKIVGDRVTFVHAEVYSDNASTVVAPAVKAFAMTFEPALFITDANSKIIDRLDAVFDAEEITEALSRAGVTTS